MAKQDKQPQHAPDTGHEWDGIRELTNPPPRWWMISFHASWIFCVVYFILYPSIPLVNEATKGVLGWTQIGELNEAVAENNETVDCNICIATDPATTHPLYQLMMRIYFLKGYSFQRKVDESSGAIAF